MTTPLLSDVEEFIALHDMPPVTFGRMAMRDPHFVRDLRGGRRVWPETESKVRTFIEGFVSPPAPDAVALCGRCGERVTPADAESCGAACPMRAAEAA